jgi:plasmid stabilization system protein ParE
MFKIIYPPKVKKDLIEIQEFIAQYNVFYGLKVIESIMDSINLLLTFPKIWKKIDDIHYMIVENNYWYKVVYKIEKENIIIMWVFKYKNSWES